jgi:DNA-binding NarL/FixJ family response regulator
MQHRKILIVDDHPMFRMGIRRTLQDTGGFREINEATAGHAAIRMVEIYRPDIVVMDAHLPGLTGVQIASTLSRRFPKSKIVLVAADGGEERILEAIQAGAAAYVPASAPPEMLVETIARILHGEQPILFDLFSRPNLAARIMSPLTGSSLLRIRVDVSSTTVVGTLSPREIEVLDCILLGLSNRNTADALFITEQTVKNHLTSILTKLGGRARTDLIRIAIRKGWCGIGAAVPPALPLPEAQPSIGELTSMLEHVEADMLVA